jgi:glycosyltransferase involved in cell wall biosynthesis
METKRVIVFHPALAPYRVDFFNELNSKFETSFYFNHENVQDQKFDQESLKKQLNFEPKYLSKGFTILKRTFRLGILKIIITSKPDIILCSEYGQITILILFYKLITTKKIKVYTLSDDSIDNSKSRKDFRALFRNIISKRLDGVILPSSEVCNWVKKNIGTNIITLELPIIHKDEIFRQKLQFSLETSRANINKFKLQKQKVILYVGRLVDVKNISTLINATKRIKTNNWKLVIVGEGNKELELKSLSQTSKLNDKIIFIGRKEGSELYSWYNIASIFVLPSIYEPFGAVVNEALLGGCRVICSNVAGAATLIQENYNGLIFSPNDIDQLQKKIDIELNDSKSIEISDFFELRKSLMPFTFIEKIELLIAKL